jgi:hypothetical protein
VIIIATILLIKSKTVISLLSTLIPTNKKLQVAINRKISGQKLKYTNLKTLQFNMIPFSPKLVNLYLIKKLSLKDRKNLERRFPKIKFKIHFICDIELELDESELEGICIGNWNSNNNTYLKRLMKITVHNIKKQV